jgi:4-diphosphocytidyl-2-C-methyl-D-erythritol kinase
MQKEALVLPSPAKLNLMLHILGRRADGYHELQTLFQFLDYGDEMTFAVRDDGVICLHTEFAGVAHDDNLIVKAAKKLQATVQACPLGIDIWIKKDPAHGRRHRRRQFQCGDHPAGRSTISGSWPGTEDRLAALGLSLGADVPVFVRGHAAFR